MMTRVLSSAAAGIAVTTGLLFLMQYLIANGEEIIVEPRIRHDLVFVPVKREEVLELKKDIPRRIDKPEPQPITDLRQQKETGGVGFRIPGPPLPVSGPDTRITNLVPADGPLVSIILVQPQYPAAAIRMGLEGTVLLQYDVTTLGTVANVVVIESSSSVFNKAAIDAVYRCRYKPRIIDGVPYETKGLRYLFRFEMEK